MEKEKVWKIGSEKLLKIKVIKASLNYSMPHLANYYSYCLLVLNI